MGTGYESIRKSIRMKQYAIALMLMFPATLAWGQGRYTIIPIEGVMSSEHQWTSWAYVVDKKDSKIWQCLAQVFDKGRRTGECFALPSKLLNITPDTEVKLTGRNVGEHYDRRFMWFINTNTGTVSFCGFGMGRVEESCFQYPPMN